MPWVNGKFVPDIPAPPPPRAPGSSAPLPQVNANYTAPRPSGGAGVPPPPTPPPPRPPGSPSGNVPTGRPNPNFSGGNAAPPPPPSGQTPPPDYDNYQPQGWQQEDARKAAGTWQDDHPDAGKWNTGDPYLDELRSGKVAGSEDWRRFSNAQLKEWQPYYLGNGQYRTFDGGISDKPTNTTKDDGSGGGAPGGGGGGGRGGGGAPANQPYLDEMNEYWKNLVKNQDKSRWSPEAMAAVEADAFARARAQEKNQLEEARADMAQRGVTGSANQNATMRGIRSGTGAAIMQNRAQVVRAKIDADYQDKQAAINNAKEWVNSMRDYMLRTDMNAIQREQIAAQIRLAQMNIKAQESMVEQNYQNNLSTYLLTNGG